MILGLRGAAIVLLEAVALVALLVGIPAFIGNVIYLRMRLF
jgi:hypothetical protein